ncbi:transporter substrate-binding domain-containing protein [Anaerofustis sp.]|uniref:transporter substrate-binding domain-containing protein n=1 Tax=Anaerofustis sp. TaxID=1872517 RepID=UPI0025BE13F0|nr:transporter substrate-binding domain-containing protein [Anaerofustis sp.]
MKKGKRILACVLALGLVLGFAGCGAKDDAGSGEKTYIIATDTAFAPFEFTDEEDNFTGIDVDILSAIAKDQGFDYELQSLGFKAAVAALESGQADAVIAGMSITDERKEKYDFSQAYYDSGVVMAIKADDSTIKGYEDLQGKSVAVKTGTEGATFAESIKDKYGFELKYFEDSPKMYEDVKTGNTVACFEDYPVMGYGISQGNGLKMVTDMEKGSSYGFAVLKGKNSELIKMFDEGLKNIKASGEYQKILDKYIASK